ncbi:MAG TPA: ROK family protein [Acidimicrobiales bacterium]|nr:ROK family protein [Acidimicrobiales bacterium]
MPLSLALDVGGTKLAAGVVDGSGRVLASHRRPTPPGADGEELFDEVVELLRQAAASASGDLAVLGVGCGGPMTPGGEEVSPINIAGWRDFPLRRRLADATGLPVFIDNDAKALARAEGWVGAAAGETDYISMVVSTGVGGGIFCDGRLLDGATGNAGHIGHVNVEPDGHRCGCGSFGCLEAEASGTAIRAITGVPAEEAEQVRPGTVERTGRMVGRAVASVCALLDLRLAAVGGSVALGYGERFFAAARAELDRLCRISFARGARIVPSALGPDGGLIGAAAVGLRALDGR